MSADGCKAGHGQAYLSSLMEAHIYGFLLSCPHSGFFGTTVPAQPGYHYCASLPVPLLRQLVPRLCIGLTLHSRPNSGMLSCNCGGQPFTEC